MNEDDRVCDTWHNANNMKNLTRFKLKFKLMDLNLTVYLAVEKKWEMK